MVTAPTKEPSKPEAEPSTRGHPSEPPRLSQSQQDNAADAKDALLQLMLPSGLETTIRPKVTYWYTNCYCKSFKNWTNVASKGWMQKEFQQKTQAKRAQRRRPKPVRFLAAFGRTWPNFSAEAYVAAHFKAVKSEDVKLEAVDVLPNEVTLHTFQTFYPAP